MKTRLVSMMTVIWLGCGTATEPFMPWDARSRVDTGTSGNDANADAGRPADVGVGDAGADASMADATTGADRPADGGAGTGGTDAAVADATTAADRSADTASGPAALQAKCQKFCDKLAADFRTCAYCANPCSTVPASCEPFFDCANPASVVVCQQMRDCKTNFITPECNAWY